MLALNNLLFSYDYKIYRIFNNEKLKIFKYIYHKIYPKNIFKKMTTLIYITK